MAQAITVTYDGIEIEYQEDSNRWRFELRGRERFTESLAKAKEAIDKPEPTKKAPFERIKAYKVGERWSDDKQLFITVEITSIAESAYGSPQVWISKGKGSREKVRVYDLFEITPENDALIAEITRLNDAQKALSKKETSARESLKRIELPKE